MPHCTRREFLGAAMAGVLSTLTARRGFAQPARPPRILLRSSWQIVNIGDIAHTPGVLALLEKYIPGAEVTLWASTDLSPEVSEMEHRRFPSLKIVKGKINADGRAANADLQAALDGCDFLLHGSGASFVAASDVATFVKHVGKPFGVYGITWGGASQNVVDLLSQAQFAFFRDTVSLAKAKADGVHAPIMEFGPDGAFGCDLRNDASAEQFLASSGLRPGKFLCCIPRYRYTPYWLIRNTKLDPQKDARNQEMKEHDHAPLRDAICAVVRETDHQVLICPEDMTHVAIGKEMLLDKLAADVLPRVVWRDKYWLTDEALSVYVRSAGLFGLEMHSPIMCIGAGIPALVGRFDEQTSKGLMWRDIGLGDWLFDMDQPGDVSRLTPTVLSLVKDPAAARAKVQAAQEVVHKRQAETMAVVKRCVEG